MHEFPEELKKDHEEGKEILEKISGGDDIIRTIDNKESFFPAHRDLRPASRRNPPKP